jgi:hypothetical protein
MTREENQDKKYKTTQVNYKTKQETIQGKTRQDNTQHSTRQEAKTNTNTKDTHKTKQQGTNKAQSNIMGKKLCKWKVEDDRIQSNFRSKVTFFLFP